MILKTCQDVGCDVMGLQKVTCDGQKAFTAARCIVFCSGADGGKHVKKPDYGVGLAARESIVAGVDIGDHAVERISARLMQVII